MVPQATAALMALLVTVALTVRPVTAALMAQRATAVPTAVLLPRSGASE